MSIDFFQRKLVHQPRWHDCVRCHAKFSASVLSLCLLALTATVPLRAEAWSEMLLVADRDNTLYETDMDELDDPHEVSNGAGIFLFAGRTNFDAGFRLRRGLIRFDLSGLPAGSEIIFAELTLYQSHVSPNAFPVTTSLHRLLEDWGEGASDGIGAEGQGASAQPGDATWFQRFYNSASWTDVGGTFAASASASTTLGLDLGDYTWDCSPALVADLQAWLDDSSANFGWIILGNEDGGGTVRRFNSRSNLDEETRPRLRVVFRPPEELFTDGFEATACSP